MRVIIVYPLAFDAWDTFSPFAGRFTYSFKEFGPGYPDYEVWAACCLGEPTDDIRKQFWNIKTQFVQYNGHGCDIGAAQRCASACNPRDLVLAMTSRCYFHREGWLARYVKAFVKYGPGLYGASASHEGGKPHICTRAYMMEAAAWQSFPQIIDSREKGQKFEVGDWCISDSFRQMQLPLVQVTWDGEQLEPNWRDKSQGGIFRRGRQNAMLVWDKHTDAYNSATDEEKIRLEKLADGD